MLMRHLEKSANHGTVRGFAVCPCVFIVVWYPSILNNPRHNCIIHTQALLFKSNAFLLFIRVTCKYYGIDQTVIPANVTLE